MKFIQGHNRQQVHLCLVSLDASIDPDNEVRIFDLFVDSLHICKSIFRLSEEFLFSSPLPTPSLAKYPLIDYIYVKKEGLTVVMRRTAVYLLA
ncbi:MAG: hypothetical protein H0U27_01825 [Nitrosopumilus sp.]|nr:hypothetical protein [Nitrosopumilus sp.]